MPTIATQTPTLGLTTSQKMLRLKRKALVCASLQAPPLEHIAAAAAAPGAPAAISDRKIKPCCDYWSCLPDEIQEYILDIVYPTFKNSVQRCLLKLSDDIVESVSRTGVNITSNAWYHMVEPLPLFTFLTPKLLAIVRKKIPDTEDEDYWTIGDNNYYGDVYSWKYSRNFKRSVELTERQRSHYVSISPQIAFARLCADKYNLSQRHTNASLFLCFNKIRGNAFFEKGIEGPTYKKCQIGPVNQNQIFLVNSQLFNKCCNERSPDVCRLKRIRIGDHEFGDGLHNNTPPLCFEIRDRDLIGRILSKTESWDGTIYSNKQIKKYKQLQKTISGKNTPHDQLKQLLESVHIGARSKYSYGLSNTKFYIVGDDQWLNNMKPVEEKTPQMKGVRLGRKTGVWSKGEFNISTIDRTILKYPESQARSMILSNYLT
jgi:hypothetical protein